MNIYKYTHHQFTDNAHVTTFTFDLPPHEPDDDLLHHDEQPQILQHAPDTSSSFIPPSHQTISLRMPQELLVRVDALAAREDTSRSHIMRRITSYVVDAIRDDPETMNDYGLMAARLYEQAKELIGREQRASISLLQRHLHLDYHMALLLMDELERTGIVTPPDDDGRRKTKLEHLMAVAKAHAHAPDRSGGSWMDRKL